MSRFEDSGQPMTSAGLAAYIALQTDIKRPVPTPNLGSTNSISNVARIAFHQAEVYTRFRLTHAIDNTTLPAELDAPTDSELRSTRFHFSGFANTVTQIANNVRRTR